MEPQDEPWEACNLKEIANLRTTNISRSHSMPSSASTSKSGHVESTSMNGSDAEAARTHSNGQGAHLTHDQWAAIQRITDEIYDFRTDDGHDPSKIFQRKVNKRLLPDYYDVIKKPVALSTLKNKILHKEYNKFEEYVRDAALISHNAQTYNRPEAGAYHDAVTLKGAFQAEFQKLVDNGIISAETAEYPDLGELPPVEDPPPSLHPEVGDEEEEEEEEDEEDEEEEDEEDEESEDEGGRRRRKRGTKPMVTMTKRESANKIEKLKSEESRRRRGRPPKVDTPMEARIKNILKGLRKFKNSDGHVMAGSFEKLPDKAERPDYYMEIKEPLAIEQIKRKAKRKKYRSVEHFLRDVDLMFNNCKSYNLEESQVYKDAVALQIETHNLAKEELARPDEEFALEEGRLPLPSGVMHDGELWKIGDWVHLQNPNDVTKPVVAQVYRAWQDSDGDKWINACWYYRPEQTVHHFEKHFLPNEVMKTGQYRDHRVEEIVGRCFVMFVTRYGRGRPRGLATGTEVYVCESRYNEEKHKMNKIKTWASCLPDEVRDQDYEMDLFEHSKKIRKVPSPLLHLLKDDVDEADAKPDWGVDNAPPRVGAIFRGPRDENQTPPPEPSPSPPPQPSAQMTKIKPPMSSNTNTPDYRSHEPRTTANSGLQVNNAAPYSAPQPPRYSQPASSVQSPKPQQFSSQHAAGSNTTGQPYSTPHNRFPSTQRPGVPESTFSRPDEVFRLPQNANLAIPEEVRNQFHQDEHGHILFFTAPPLNTLQPVKPGSAVGHTAKYLADKLRKQITIKEKRKESDDTIAEDLQSQNGPAKKLKQDTVDPELASRISTTKNEALKLLIKQMQNGTDRIYQDLYGSHWEAGKEYETERLMAKQAEARREKEELDRRRRLRVERQKVSLAPSTAFKDDFDPRY